MKRDELQAIQNELVQMLLSGASGAVSPDTRRLLLGVNVQRFRMLREMVFGKRVVKCQYILPRTFEHGSFSADFLNGFCQVVPFTSSEFYVNAAQFYFFLRHEARAGRLSRALEELCFTELAIAEARRRPIIADSVFPRETWFECFWAIRKGVRLRAYSYDVFGAMLTNMQPDRRKNMSYGVISKPLKSLSGNIFAVNASAYALLRSLGRDGGRLPNHLQSASGKHLVEHFYRAGIIRRVSCASV